MAVSYENLPGAGGAQVGSDLPNVREIHTSPGALDATLPPTPIRELLAASGATLFVLATDASLVATIRRAAEQHPLYVVESWTELLQAVESERCGIALLDAAVLGPRVAECVARLAAYADRLVTLVASDRAAAHQYVGLLSDGRVHRLLIKPTAVGAARLLIESATARRLQLREESVKNGAPKVDAKASRAILKKRWIVAGGASAVLLIGAAVLVAWLAGWNRFLTSGEAAAVPAAVTTVPVVEPAPTLEERLAEHRAKAAAALQEGRFVEPAGDNALDHYRAILALLPTDEPARDGISSVVEGLFTRAEQALLADSLEDAATALDHARRVTPSSSRLAFLDAQLARALAALAVLPPAPAAPVSSPAASAPTELDSTLSLAAARLRRGQLLSPSGDSAREYLERALELAPNDARVAALRTDLTAALIAAARLVSASDIAGATNLAAEARALGGESTEFLALESELAAARALEEERRQGARLEIARARVQSGALFAPSGDSALDHLLGLQAAVPELEGLAEAWATFQPAAVLAIEGAIERGEWSVADTQLQGLEQAPGGEAAAAPLATELAARRLQQSFLATAAQVSVLTLQSAVPVVYPPDALEREIQGWVDLEFVVDRNGRTRDLVVTQSSPPGRFDGAAVDAVAQYRYVPFERDGRVYERRIKMRVRFQLQ
jgi:protein TonB